MDHLICASLSHSHYEVGMLKVRVWSFKEYVILIKDSYSNNTCYDVYFKPSKNVVIQIPHAISSRPSLLCHTLSPVETMRTDDAAEFKSGYFVYLYGERSIRQKFTTTSSPQFNGVMKELISMIESKRKIVLIQAKRMFAGMGIPLSDFLWAAQVFRACYALDLATTQANLKYKSPCAMLVLL